MQKRRRRHLQVSLLVALPLVALTAAMLYQVRAAITTHNSEVPRTEAPALNEGEPTLADARVGTEPQVEHRVRKPRIAAPNLATPVRAEPPYEPGAPLRFETWDLFVEHAKPTLAQMVELEMIFHDAYVEYWSSYDLLMNQARPTATEAEELIHDMQSSIGEDVRHRIRVTLSPAQLEIFGQLFRNPHRLAGAAMGNMAHSIRQTLALR